MSLAAVKIEQAEFSPQSNYSTELGFSGVAAQYWPKPDREERKPVIAKAPGRLDDRILVSDGDIDWSRELIAAARQVAQSLDQSAKATVASTFAQKFAISSFDWIPSESHHWTTYYDKLKAGLKHIQAKEVLISAIKASDLLSSTYWAPSFLADQQIFAKFQLKETANAYYAMLADALGERGFDHEQPYEDVLGNQVLDFIRDFDRITIVLRDGVAQAMTHINAEFATEAFEGLERSKPAVVDYLFGLLDQ